MPKERIPRRIQLGITVWYKPGSKEPYKRYAKRVWKDFWNMYPKTRTFGWRYLYDEDYRHKCKTISDNRKQKQKYGSGYLARRKTVKNSLAARHGLICQGCRHKFSLKELTIDHIVRVYEGGSNSITNLQLLCYPCHADKSRQENMRDLGMTPSHFMNQPFALAFQRMYERKEER